MELNVAQLLFDVVVKDVGAALSILHASVMKFERFFRKECCCNERLSCDECNESNICPYRRVFGQVISSDPEIVRRHQKPPLPFAFKIRQSQLDTSCIEVSITVLGDALVYIAEFHRAIIWLLETARINNDIVIKSVSGSCSLDHMGNRHCHGQGLDTLVVISGNNILNSVPLADSVKLFIETPMRLMGNGSLLREFDFSALFRSQLRRCSSLCSYYGEGTLDIDYAWLSGSSEKVSVLEDSISFTVPCWSEKIGRAGLIGSADLSGLVDNMLPVLVLGSFFNAGKGAAYGMGTYRIET